MIFGEAETTVGVSKGAVVEFVLDLERYRQADHKIGRVGEIQRDGDAGTVRFAGRITGLPGPSGVYPFEVTATGLRFGSPVAGAARWFLDFEGTFDYQETEDGPSSATARRSSSNARGAGSPNRCFGAG